jgi:hypothetical protein
MLLSIFTVDRTSTVVISAEGAEPAHLAHVLAVGGLDAEARRVVPPRTDQQVRAGVADVLLPIGAEYRHRPQPGRNEKTTWSPSSKPFTPGPTAVTTPAPSWPPRKGVLADGHVTGGDVVVGVAQPGGGQLDLEFAGLRIIDDEVDDLPWPGADRRIAPRVFTGTGTSSSPSSLRAVRACVGTHD